MARERGETEFRFVGNEKRIPVYFIAVASNSSESLPQPGSVLLDYSNSLVQEKNEEILATRKEIHWREQQIEDRKEQIESLESALEWREGRIKDLDGKISALEEALKWLPDDAETRRLLQELKGGSDAKKSLGSFFGRKG